jgi:hypothetical protein
MDKHILDSICVFVDSRLIGPYRPAQTRSRVRAGIITRGRFRHQVRPAANNSPLNDWGLAGSGVYPPALRLKSICTAWPTSLSPKAGISRSKQRALAR